MIAVVAELAYGLAAIAAVAALVVGVRFAPDVWWSCRRRWLVWREDRSLRAQINAHARLVELERRGSR
jgi:hypothetical protein